MPGGGGRVKRFSRLLLSGQPPHVHGPSAWGKTGGIFKDFPVFKSGFAFREQSRHPPPHPLPGTSKEPPSPTLPPGNGARNNLFLWALPCPKPLPMQAPLGVSLGCGCHSARTQGNGRPPIPDAVLRHPGPRRAGTARPTPPRTCGIASFSPDNSLSWHGISMRPEGPWLPDSPKKQCKAWRCPGRNRSPNGSVWRVPLFVLLCKSRRVLAPLGRCSAGKTRRCGLLPRPCGWRAGGKKDKQGKSGQDRGRETGGGNLQDCPECRSADSDAGQGGRINIETMKTASRTWKEGGMRMERDCQTIPTIPDNSFGDNLDNSRPLLQGAGRTTPPGGRLPM